MLHFAVGKMRKLAMNDHLTVREPKGFAALGQPGSISKEYQDKSIFTVQIDHKPTAQEITVTEKKLDRLHAFQQGLAVGLLLRLRKDFEQGGLAETPEALVKVLRKELEAIEADVKRYAVVVLVNPDQLVLGATL